MLNIYTKIKNLDFKIKEFFKSFNLLIYSNTDNSSFKSFTKKEKFFLVTIFLLFSIIYLRGLNYLLLWDETYVFNETKIEFLKFFYGSIMDNLIVLTQLNPYILRTLTFTLHLINVFLFLFLFRKYLNISILKITTLFYILHAVNVESLIWIQAFSYVFRGFILLVCFLILEWGKDKTNIYSQVLIFLILVLNLQDIRFYYLVGTLMIYEYFFHKKSVKEILKKYFLMMFFQIIFYLYLYSALYLERAGFYNYTSNESNLYKFFLVQEVQSFVRHLEISILPLRVVYLYYFNSNNSLIILYYLFLIPIFFIVLHIFKYSKLLFGFLCLGLSTCFVMFLPINVTWSLANRYMYFHLFVLCFLYSSILFFLILKRSMYLKIVIFSLFIFFHTLVLVNKIDDWSSYYRLFVSNANILGFPNVTLDYINMQNYFYNDSYEKFKVEAFKYFENHGSKEGLLGNYAENNDIIYLFLSSAFLIEDSEVFSNTIYNVKNISNSKFGQEVIYAYEILNKRRSGIYNDDILIWKELYERNYSLGSVLNLTVEEKTY